MSATGRYIVVTPYDKEEKPLLERCIASVRAQAVAAEHLLVADGFEYAIASRLAGVPLARQAELRQDHVK
jgi:hypothetical protein